MKEITYEEWQKRFTLKNGVELDAEPDGCTFYDNGAVKTIDTEEFG